MRLAAALARIMLSATLPAPPSTPRRRAISLPSLAAAAAAKPPWRPLLHAAAWHSSAVSNAASGGSSSSSTSGALDLPAPPTEPDPAECCGRGCPECVWTVYYEDLQAHHAQVAALTGKAPPEDPFAAMERRLAEQQRVQQLQAASAAASYTQLSRQDGGPLASPAQEAQAGSDGGTTPEHQQTAAAHPHQQQ